MGIRLEKLHFRHKFQGDSDKGKSPNIKQMAENEDLEILAATGMTQLK